MLCFPPQLSSSRVSWEMRSYPLSSSMCSFKEHVRFDTCFLKVFVFLILCDKVLASTGCLVSDKMPQKSTFNLIFNA